MGLTRGNLVRGHLEQHGTPAIFFSSCPRRCHLQCLRHLYVLATKPRRLCGVDVETNQVTRIGMSYWLKVSVMFQSLPQSPAIIFSSHA